MFHLSAEEARERLASYFDYVEKGRLLPTMSGLCRAVECSPQQLLEESSRDTPLGWALLEARLVVCDRVEQRSDAMSILKLKQPIYCGFVDKVSGSGSGSGGITLTLEGDVSAWDAGG